MSRSLSGVLSPSQYRAYTSINTNNNNIIIIMPFQPPSIMAACMILLAAPKLLQALSAALLDCYTWKIAERAHGPATRTAYAAVGTIHPFIHPFIHSLIQTHSSL